MNEPTNETEITETNWDKNLIYKWSLAGRREAWWRKFNRRRVSWFVKWGMMIGAGAGCLIGYALLRLIWG